MGRHNLFTVHTPSVASAVHSAATSLLSFVTLSVTPSGAMLNEIVELVWEIVVVSDNVKSHRRQELVYFGKYVKQVVDRLVVALRNEQISQQANVMDNLEELHRVLKSILHDISSINESGSSRQRIRQALYHEEDPVNVARMRQLLHDALDLFQLTAMCELLARPSNPGKDQTADIPPPPSDSHGSNELAVASLEVGRLRSLFRQHRGPPNAWKLAASLTRYSDLLAESGRHAEALVACQESAGLYKSLAERGKVIYYGPDGHITTRTSEEIYEGDWGC